MLPKLEKPKVVVLAGPNGAGKSTSAEALLAGALGVHEFVNADVIAQGLSAFAPDRVAIAAGRIMLQRIGELSSRGVSFAFETTLASRTFAPRLRSLIRHGYTVHIVFLWLPSADVAVARVAERVRLGGHDVPGDTIHRRYRAGICNFFELYQPLAESWEIIDNTRGVTPRLIAFGHGAQADGILDLDTWHQLQQSKAG